ncbi:MAG: zinc-ribbon domain-containing protein [Roseovarius sp.]|nr:zinc-ribbon domain-containing protein [Roseovarius sp.]
MRLICPNCEAQYEVPDEVIPASGRDVQCSNCGDTWFQNHPDSDPQAADDSEDEQTWDAPNDDVTEAAADSAVDPEDQREPEADTRPARQELDPSVTDVLKEEAELERAAREQENTGLETQPDLGLEAGDDEAAKRSREAQARMALLRGDSEHTADEDALPDLDPGTRRNLLPDIDEINSSLSAGNPVQAVVTDTSDVEHPLPPRKSGFRRGFMMIVLLAVIGLLLYMFAPQLAEMVPALKPVLMSYVEMVNGLRAWLDGKVLGLLG